MRQFWCLQLVYIFVCCACGLFYPLFVFWSECVRAHCESRSGEQRLWLPHLTQRVQCFYFTLLFIFFCMEIWYLPLYCHGFSSNSEAYTKGRYLWLNSMAALRHFLLYCESFCLRCRMRWPFQQQNKSENSITWSRAQLPSMHLESVLHGCWFAVVLTVVLELWHLRGVWKASDVMYMSTLEGSALTLYMCE